jgi:glycerol-3-phosphate dehydrogenase (NAD(P)+)
VSRIAILGCGSWGTALAKSLSEAGNEVRLWGHLAEEIDPINAENENRKYLPGILLPKAIIASTDLDASIKDTDAILLVVPSQVIREVSRRLAASPNLPAQAAWVLAAKGLDPETGNPLGNAIEDEAGSLGDRLMVLVGPSHAEEVGQGVATALVLAAPPSALREKLQHDFSSDNLRVYVNEDRTGSQLGVALKNVIALAAGICDGIGMGDNTKGALLSRGLAEMGRFIESFGGRRETLLGLAGVGDLVTTCFSKHSRNRYVGEELGKGRKVDDILTDMVQVAEGVFTARTLHTMALDRKVEMPITEKIHGVLFEDVDPREAIRSLMTRDPAPEIRKGGVHGSSA